jgi:enhancing lycopene biosynthesis protein 2
MTKIAVILSGSGVFDGSEIHESVLTMLAIEAAGYEYQCLAPDVDQHHVTNHVDQTMQDHKRNVLVESARIARGNVIALAEAQCDDYDGAIYPGGFGAASTLCDYSERGELCQLDPSVLTFAKGMAQAGKPQGFLCIAPVLISAIYGKGVVQTIGSDSDTAAKIEAMGGVHQNCSVDQAVVDKTHKVVSSPAYMLAKSMSEVHSSVNALLVEFTALLN